MKIMMCGLYGIDDCKAYYRKAGDCFDFCNSKEFASELEKEEADRILKCGDWYCKQYGAKSIEAID